MNEIDATESIPELERLRDKFWDYANHYADSRATDLCLTYKNMAYQAERKIKRLKNEQSNTVGETDKRSGSEIFTRAESDSHCEIYAGSGQENQTGGRSEC